MNRVGLVFEKQWLHFVGLLALLAGVAAASTRPQFQAGELLSLTTPTWAWIAVGLAIAHQMTVWFCWRMELHLAAITALFGSRGFRLYGKVFALLGISRAVAVFLVAIAGRDTVDAAPLLFRTLAVVALLLAVWLFWSVHRHFGFRRALGADHFDPAYRSMPLVRQGIFRLTSNGMYVFGFLIVWAPALWTLSFAGLVLAAFNHLYVWVHYFATERPDMRHIYGSD